MATKVTRGEEVIHPDSVRNVFVDFAKELSDTGDDLTGTPVVTEVTTSDLTLENKAVGGTTFTDDEGYSWTANKYVTFTASGWQDDTDYEVLIKPTTDAANAETLAAVVKFRCRGN